MGSLFPEFLEFERTRQRISEIKVPGRQELNGSMEIAVREKGCSKQEVQKNLSVPIIECSHLYNKEAACSKCWFNVDYLHK